MKKIYSIVLSIIFSSSVGFSQAAASAEQPSPLLSFVPIIFIFVVMYFLMIRPQAKRQKEHQKFLGELKRGDEVLTSSGIIGKIEGLAEQFVTLEIADGVRVKMLRTQVAGSAKVPAQTTERK